MIDEKIKIKIKQNNHNKTKELLAANNEKYVIIAVRADWRFQLDLK